MPRLFAARALRRTLGTLLAASALLLLPALHGPAAGHAGHHAALLQASLDSPDQVVPGSTQDTTRALAACPLCLASGQARAHAAAAALLRTGARDLSAAGLLRAPEARAPRPLDLGSSPPRAPPARV